jgi:peptide-methionine (S)-S-oxide reductase
MELATIAGGCFWCTEAIFQRLKGVEKVEPGYSGGDTPNPTYEQVCSGTTGHAEAIQITFDPKVISYEKLLEIFMALHDPTTLNQQGADTGTQYRSSIFYHNDEQKMTAEKVKDSIEKSGKYSKPIVTEIVPFKEFYKAEDYHQNYFNNNKNAMYCQVVIDPKVQKLLQEYKNEVKNE